VTTRQHPKRRETDEQKRRRDEDAAVRREEYEKKCRPLPHAFKHYLPRISHKGRLVR
jgi:hypothetical protein